VPGQLPDVGVTVYTTFFEVFVVLTRLPLIEFELVPPAVPVIPRTVGADQE
jgi:hypothetical protein